jgi:hypothetical protein
VVPAADGSLTVGAGTAAFYPGVVQQANQDGTYVLQHGEGRELCAAGDCVFPYENPVDFGAEEVPVRVRAHRHALHQ